MQDDEKRRKGRGVFHHSPFDEKNKSLTAQRLAEQYYLSRTQLEKVISKVSKWFFEKNTFRLKGAEEREFQSVTANSTTVWHFLAHCRENTAFLLGACKCR
ncbi:MAG: hypothetical protein L6V93_17570 [Clostridiales bacterium]|nr:MAG: hypothetical protein L6V93_17570 [Clostridiales bacterium]